MADSMANEGVALVNAGKYVEGIEKLSRVLQQKPAPKWLIERSKAYLRTNDFDLALHDAEQALAVAFKRANRDLMIEAQLRRAITLFRMGRYADADVVAFWATELLDGAKAMEDDGQDRKVDSNGDYTVTYEEVQSEQPKPEKGDAMATAMGGGAARSKTTSLKNQAYTWRTQALTALAKLPTGDAGKKVTVVKYPDPETSKPKPKPRETQRVMELDDEDEEEKEHGSNKAAIPAAVLAPIEQTWESIYKQFQDIHTKNDVRTDFYQSETALTVSLFVKNVNKDELKVDAQEQSVTLSPVPTGSGRISLKLYGKIKPAETNTAIKSMKIELILQKAEPGKWPILRQEGSSIFDNILSGPASALSQENFVALVKKLGFTEPSSLSLEKFAGDALAWYRDLVGKLGGSNDTSSSMVDSTTTSSSAGAAVAPSKAAAPEVDPAALKTAAHSYPTSSKSGPKNWDNIDAEDEDGAEKGGDVNSFFQKLYKDADPDMQRAMMKSYVESNGTSLSTSWSEAKDKKYKTDPPDGVEAKKWNE